MLAGYRWEINQVRDISLFMRCPLPRRYIKVPKTLCQDEFRSLSRCVPEILTACRMHQILIAWCQIEAEIRGFPTMYTMRGGKYSQNWRKTWFCPNFRPKNTNFSGQKFWTYLPPPMIYMVGKPRISASFWHQVIEIWSILQSVRISGTHPDRLLNSSCHCVLYYHQKIKLAKTICAK